MMIVGDIVTRLLPDCVTSELMITGIDDDVIICGFLEFDKNTGDEIDDDFPISMLLFDDEEEL